MLTYAWIEEVWLSVLEGAPSVPLKYLNILERLSTLVVGGGERPFGVSLETLGEMHSYIRWGLTSRSWNGGRYGPCT
jgi:hypothetical protein